MQKPIKKGRHHHHGEPKVLPRKIPIAKWRLAVSGCGKCKKPHRYSIADVVKFPPATRRAVFFCSHRGGVMARWSGILLRHLIPPSRLTPGTKSVVLYGRDGHWGAMPVEKIFASGAILATRRDGRPLTHRQGGPVRLFVPKGKGWQSVKWISRMAFTKRIRRGHKHKE